MKIDTKDIDLPKFRALAGVSRSAHSWPEDYADENGKYLNQCVTCNEHFMGHRRRNVCKLCDAENQKWWDSLTDHEKREHIAEVAGEVRRIFGPNVEDQL